MAVGVAAAILAGCSTSNGAAADASAGPMAVRGRVASVSDSTLTVSSAAGEVRVALVPPVAVYASVPADLSRVTARTFVGVSSITGADGAQRATEIHIFPEALRGTGEGSYLMAQQDSGSGRRSTMTNGTVVGARAGGGAAGSPPRMTNGAVQARAGGSLVVRFRGGEQTITIPAGIPITEIARSRTGPAIGANVVVLTVRQPDGALRSSAVLLAGGPGPSR